LLEGKKNKNKRNAENKIPGKGSGGQLQTNRLEFACLGARGGGGGRLTLDCLHYLRKLFEATVLNEGEEMSRS
jgi:hypothetical protein